MNMFKLLAVASLVAEILGDLVSATTVDSPGGRKITKAERRLIIQGLRAKLLDDEFEAKIEALGL